MQGKLNNKCMNSEKVNGIHKIINSKYTMKQKNALT